VERDFLLIFNTRKRTRLEDFVQRLFGAPRLLRSFLAGACPGLTGEGAWQRQGPIADRNTGAGTAG
jgi:hypothetical protein